MQNFFKIFFYLFMLTLASKTMAKVNYMKTPNIKPYLYSKQHPDGDIKNIQARKLKYPTQIIRLMVEFDSHNVNCAQIEKSMRSIVNELFAIKDIIATAGAGCGGGEPLGNYSFDAYFDPLTHEAASNLQKFKADYDGMDFYGATFKVESAKGLVVSLNIDTGVQDSGDSSVIDIKHHYNKKLYFDSFYDMETSLEMDIESKLFTNDKELITAFFEKWGPMDYLSDYLSFLNEVNAVRVKPELIFLMDTEPKAHEISVGSIYTHDCKIYPGEKCLEKTKK